MRSTSEEHQRRVDVDVVRLTTPAQAMVTLELHLTRCMMRTG
jgi:hypothetical protein